VYKSLWICHDPSARERVLACDKFHKKPVYSIVQVANGENEEWFARVLILFRARNRDLCLVQWFENQVDRRKQLVQDVTGMKRLVKGAFQVRWLTSRAFACLWRNLNCLVLLAFRSSKPTPSSPRSRPPMLQERTSTTLTTGSRHT